MNVLFVCTGNTCRSPMAEGIFKRMLEESNVQDIQCASAGLSAFTGDAVSEFAVMAATKYGADISGHRAREINDFLLNETDLFVCMTHTHAAVLSGYVYPEKIVVLGGGIPDPYGGNQTVYERCAEKIKESLSALLIQIRQMLRIVPMREEHIEALAGLEKECFVSPWSERQLREELNRSDSYFLVAEIGEKVVGYIGIKDIAGECNITNIAVTASARRQKVGSKLLDEAIRQASARKDAFITLEVRKSNRGAIALYEKQGFAIVGERKDFYSNPRENALLMTKNLITNEK